MYAGYLFVTFMCPSLYIHTLPYPFAIASLTIRRICFPDAGAMQVSVISFGHDHPVSWHAALPHP